jgi:hypothetical protein
VKINYGIVQLALLALVVAYAIALMCGVTVPVGNKEAFAGVWAVIILLLNPDKLRDRIRSADDAPGAPPAPSPGGDPAPNDPAAQ